MKFIKSNNSNFSIEITPLIDIVFLLVIFFVVTSKVGDSQFLSLELPKTESFSSNTVQEQNEVSILSNGTVLINGITAPISDRQLINELVFSLDSTLDKVILSAEEDAYHQWVVELMDILNKNGYSEVQIRTIRL
ncbi:biopolymer transporter ExbD [Gammaproteobacteria bacterium]|jgi:biopolymer transport protein ExbD|nr:biopolymer transporter ExbD [Gammaproteobacteria bacterium]MDA7786862.1 biopolymer transporter ExbD [Gammaproteobacteria bacterium]MDA7802403.1 biopolymer transporter ExbD [Gammaproteobacteria bacterium]MDA7856826.1 biopolymer transporter ExbD [Gammaproteobacteria bacterium]MDA9045244.1 biopolymer transporter ExbD [Gammaproteobacteria bacterium]|tara:strand:+ start:1091 stop:1495 length:405 start_codon:yes stop_codon:yes gene_type:complete